MKKYRKRNNLLKEYNPEILDLLRQHISEGRSFCSFSGRLNIPHQRWEKWAREVPELCVIREEYNATLRKKRVYNTTGPKVNLDLINKKNSKLFLTKG